MSLEHSGITPGIRLSDTLLYAAYDTLTTPSDRISSLQAGYLAVQETILTPDWKEFDPNHFRRTSSTIHAAMTAACLPSLLAVANKQQQDRTVSTATFEKLQELCVVIWQSAELQNENRPDHDRIRSAEGELAALSILLYGAREQLIGDITHALPATDEQDGGRVCLAPGLPILKQQTGFDILASEDSGQQWPIQVKLSGSERMRKRNRKQYRFGITTVYIEDLCDVDEDQSPGREIIRAVAFEDTPVLDTAARRVLNRIIKDYSISQKRIRTRLQAAQEVAAKLPDAHSFKLEIIEDRKSAST